MKLSPLARRVNRLSVLSFFIIQISTVIASEVFSQMFNPTKNLDYMGRLHLAANPKLAVFIILICSATGFLICAYLKPLWIELETAEERRNPKNSARARMVAVRLPWTLMLYNAVLWTFAIILFYYLNGGSMPSGLPFFWVLVIKITEALAGTLINSFIIDALLKEPKQLLNITKLNVRERDHFVELKNIIIPLSGGLIILSHLAFVTWFFLIRESGSMGPQNPVFSIVLVGSLALVLLFYISVLSKRQDTIQFNLLDSQILALASSNSADLNRKVSILNFDETGHITESLNIYLEVLHQMVTQIRGGCGTLKENESGLSASMFEAEEKLKEINESVQRANDQIAQQIEATDESTRAVTGITGKIQELHAAVSQQTASVDNSSAGIEEMIANITAVSLNVQRVHETCETLLSSAERGKGKINESNTLIGKVVEASALLLDANKMIAAIAAQTNLLAMNAAIEAAHAGAAGAGFAVVADEIRSLAEKSSKQSNIVNSQLKEVRSAIENAVTSANDASTGFDEVLNLINEVTDMERENAEAMKEQKTGSDQVAQTLSEMQQTTNTVNAAAGTLTEESVHLQKTIERLVACSRRARQEMDGIMNDTMAMNATFDEVSELKENNSQIFQHVSEQVGRFIL